MYTDIKSLDLKSLGDKKKKKLQSGVNLLGCDFVNLSPLLYFFVLIKGLFQLGEVQVVVSSIIIRQTLNC